MTTYNETAKAFAAAFETFTRDDGTRYHGLAEGSPEWMRDAIYSAHEALGGRLPDDWTYQHCSLIANAIATDYPDATEASDIDECELCDPLVDIYTSDLTRWLASHLDNLALCDEAQSEGLVPEDADLVKRISVGQYIALTRICDALRVAIENAPIHLLKTRGGSQCGEVGATDADITCITCDECLKQHDAITCDVESDVQL